MGRTKQRVERAPSGREQQPGSALGWDGRTSAPTAAAGPHAQCDNMSSSPVLHVSVCPVACLLLLLLLQVKKHSEFISYPIQLWTSKTVDKEVSDDEEDEVRQDRGRREGQGCVVTLHNSVAEQQAAGTPECCGLHPWGSAWVGRSWHAVEGTWQ